VHKKLGFRVQTSYGSGESATSSNDVKVKVKGSLIATGTRMSDWNSQCYLPPGRGDIRAHTPRAGLSERGALARFGCHGERGARAYKVGLGRSDQRGSKGHSPRWRVRGALQSRP